MKRKKKALITGITGQDGSIMAELLLKKGYIVHGIKRRTSSLHSTIRLDKIYQDKFIKKRNLILHYGDITDASNCAKIINDILPDEVYHFAAQSHVAISFELPVNTVEINCLGTINILESIRLSKKKIKFYNAASSEMYGSLIGDSQNEKTPFLPQSPYASSKLFGYWITKNYRESYNIFAANGILFNHESDRRGENFLTRKVVIFVAKYILAKKGVLYLGNLSSKRDWGYAPDYMDAVWKILQLKKPEDFVIATGVSISVREFVKQAFSIVGVKVKFKGRGVDEVGIDVDTGKVIVKSIQYYYRESEVQNLIGNASKAKRILKWKPKNNIYSIIKKMVYSEIEKNKNSS